MIKQIFGSTKDFLVTVLTLTATTVVALLILAKDAVLTIAPIVTYALGGLVVLLAGVIVFVLSADQIEAYWTRRAERKRDRVLARNEAAESDLSLERTQYYTLFERALMSGQVRQLYDGKIFGSELGEAKFAAHTTGIATMNETPLLGAPLPKLSLLLPKAQRILIAGGQNSGKTTVCQWIAYYKLQAGRVIVIDSHATPARWPGGCEVIGAGRDYDRIEALLKWMMREMDRRFKEQAQGTVPERGHEIISIVSDEWTILPEVIKNVDQYTTPLLTETRKAGFDFYLAAHDTTVEALGIRGKGGLRKAFDFAVLCDYDFPTTDHHTYVNFMKAGRVSEKDNVEYESPGPFVIQGAAQPVAPIHPLLSQATGDIWRYDVEPEEKEAEPTPNEEEAQAITGFVSVRDSGDFSWNKATQAAFGEGKFGSNYTNKLKRILDEFSVDYGEYMSK